MEMSRRIPQSIQEKVIGKWLEGKSRDQIARELKISSGSVSSIIQGRRRKNGEFDLLRVVAVILRQLGIDVQSFAPLIRVRQLLELEYSDSGKLTEVEEETIDSLLEALIVFCFRGKKTVAEFGALVHSLFHIADEFGIALSNLPTYVNNLAAKATVIRKEIDLLCTKKERLLKDYEVTNDVINDILSNGPYMLGAHLDMKTRVREIENEREKYRNELKNLKMMIRAQEIEAARKAI
jgi:transcriptional regulator with XRE-family HTH domain